MNSQEIKYDRICNVFDSSNIETISYSFEESVMFVRFNTSAEYCYSGVTPVIWRNIVTAVSVGAALRDLVTSNPLVYPFERVDI